MEIEGSQTQASAGAAAAVTSSPVSVATPRPKARPLRLVLALALVVGAGAFAYSYLSAGEESTDAAQVSADMLPVATRVPGQVVKVNIVENQVVKKGDLLAQIDSVDYEARVKQAEAELATAVAQAQAAVAQVQVVDANSRGGLMSARAMVSGSAAGVGSAAAQIASARASVLRAETEVRKAKIDLERARELRAANAVPQERLDSAQIAFDSSQAALAQAQAQLAVARESKLSAETRVREAKGHLDQSAPIDAQLAVVKAQAELAKARVRSAEAQLELARLQLSYTKIVAPSDGIASKLSVHEGQLLGQGQPIIELVPIATYVIANFKETQIGKMKPGQTATIKIDSFPGRSFVGRIESLAGGTGASFALLPADNASGNFVKVVQRVPVRIDWVSPPQDLVLRAGLSADVTVHIGR
jgi:membrane fusion protein (multidrug efflux system)